MSDENQATGNSGKRTRVSMADFIEAWENSDSVQEVADKLGISKGSAGQRASTYRNKHDIDLKEMPRGGGARLDVSRGQELLEQIRKRQAENASA